MSGSRYGSLKKFTENFGFGQKEWQALESGRSKFGIEASLKIAEKTGLPLDWLLTGSSFDLEALICRVHGRLPEGDARRAGWYAMAKTLALAAAAGLDGCPPDRCAEACNRCYFLAVFAGSDIEEEIAGMAAGDAAMALFSPAAAATLESAGYFRERSRFGHDAVALAARDFLTPGFAAVGSLPRPNAEPVRKLAARGIPVVGTAAADETYGRNAGFFPENPEAGLDGVRIPETTSAVRIIGNSMSPVLLDGQYALVGPEHGGRFDRPKNGEIAVAGIAEGVSGGHDWQGVYCKRVFDGGAAWVFSSISAHGTTPFAIDKRHVRLWPVIGVWFAGKGKPPSG